MGNMKMLAGKLTVDGASDKQARMGLKERNHTMSLASQLEAGLCGNRKV